MKVKWHRSLTRVTLLSRLLAFVLFLTFPIAGFYLGMKYQRLVDIYSFIIYTNPQITQSTMTTISMMDLGRTKYMRVGDEITVALGDTINWVISMNNPSVLQQISGSPVVYKAIAPGTVIISATGRPACKGEQPCSTLAVSFRSVIVVK